MLVAPLNKVVMVSFVEKERFELRLRNEKTVCACVCGGGVRGFQTEGTVSARL